MLRENLEARTSSPSSSENRRSDRGYSDQGQFRSGSDDYPIYLLPSAVGGGNLNTMAAETPGSPEDYSLFLSENGHLSFENPNYQAERPERSIC